MSSAHPNPASELPFRSADVFELWGDTPLFPGPGWRLAWALAEVEQQQLHGALIAGRLAERLRETLPELAIDPDPWQAIRSAADQPGIAILRAIVALAQLLLQPAELEISDPLLPVRLHPDALLLRSNQHALAGSALRMAARFTGAAWLLDRGAAPPNPAGLRRDLADLRVQVRICCDHPLTAAQLAEAHRRGIPAFLIDPSQRLYQLGTGIHSRWISSTSNDRDSAFGVEIARDKRKTHDLLRQLGLPVPREMRLPVNGEDRDLLKAATRIGYPCVLKPQDAEQGCGVTANIIADSELLAAAQKARKYSRRMLLLQEHIMGDDFRLNVVDCRLMFVVKRTPPSITGNGINTALELIEQENVQRLERRAAGQIAGMIDAHDPEVMLYLSRVGLAMDSRPEVGQKIRLRGHANVSTGGHREVIDLAAIHPVIRRQCEAIACSLRLEICGIDYISPDISLPPEQCPGAYIEVNSMPQNNLSRVPMLLDNLFPEGRAHSMPTTIIIAHWHQLSASRLAGELDALLSSHPGATIGIPASLRRQIWPLLSSRDQQHAQVYGHPRELSLNRAISHAIHLTSPELILSRGLPVSGAVTLIPLERIEQLQPAAAWQQFFQSYGHTPAGMR